MKKIHSNKEVWMMKGSQEASWSLPPALCIVSGLRMQVKNLKTFLEKEALVRDRIEATREAIPTTKEEEATAQSFKMEL